MKLVILVQAHKYPEQIERMLRPFIPYENIKIFVNIDAKTDIKPFKNILSSKVIFIKKRVAIYWSNLSQVNGMLNSFKEISNIEYDYLIFMSGQDYVLKPVNNIIDFLNNNYGKEFIECEEVSPNNLNWQVRYEKYHFTHLNQFWQRIGKLMRQMPFYKRTYPCFDKIYGGGAWFMLSKAAINYSMQFCQDNPEFVSFHKYAHCPDEYFFQTILMNSPFRDKIVNNNYWYIDWFSQANNPKTLKTIHFNRLINSNKFFARKFDYKIDETVLDLIDGHINENFNSVN